MQLWFFKITYNIFFSSLSVIWWEAENGSLNQREDFFCVYFCTLYCFCTSYCYAFVVKHNIDNYPFIVDHIKLIIYFKPPVLLFYFCMCMKEGDKLFLSYFMMLISAKSSFYFVLYLNCYGTLRVFCLFLSLTFILR